MSSEVRTSLLLSSKVCEAFLPSDEQYNVVLARLSRGDIVL